MVNQSTILVITCLCILIYIFSLHRNWSWALFDVLKNSPDDLYYPFQKCDQQRLIITAKGRQSYAQLDTDVFRPFGFTIEKNCTPFPVLNFTVPLSCRGVFEGWLAIADQHNSSLNPMVSIPDNLKDDYLLNGASVLIPIYRNDKEANTSESINNEKWTAESVAQMFNSTELYTISGYGLKSLSVSNAFRRYRSRITGKNGLVIGSIRPWIEVLALQNGAKSVATAEYRNIPLGDPRLKYVHPIEMARRWKNYTDKFDFIASFSSIEHSGLGRYGDPPDPVGDLREMQKLWCFLQPGQLLFIGFPVGRDEVVFNLHRTYGAVRLAMMFTGWRLIDVFFNEEQESHKLSVDDLESYGDLRQMLFVLEKI